MAAEFPDNQEFNPHDIPQARLDALLHKLRLRPLFLRLTEERWTELRTKQPNVAHFIATSSYEVAPEDPYMRERVAAMLIGFYDTIEEDRAIETLEAQWGEQLAGIFQSDDKPPTAA